MGGVSARFRRDHVCSRTRYPTRSSSRERTTGSAARGSHPIASPSPASTLLRRSPSTMANIRLPAARSRAPRDPSTLASRFIVRTRAATGYSQTHAGAHDHRHRGGGFRRDFGAAGLYPDGIAYDGQDVVYLLSSANRLLFRWSISESHYLDPYAVGFGGRSRRPAWRIRRPSSPVSRLCTRAPSGTST